ncbi:MAG: chlorite dismutase family protein [Acidobacteriota bacterium]
MGTRSNPGTELETEAPAKADAASGSAALERLDISEKGGVRGGERQSSDRRLFVQLLVFGDCTDSKPLMRALAFAGLEVVLYEDLNDPHGVAILTVTEDPAVFAGPLREFLNNRPFSTLTLKPEYTMLGRTYALGYEPDLEETLLKKPRRTLTNPEWPWAIWYPLRRKGEFANLAEEQQRMILKEHGSIGIAFGQADFAHDIRLACFGLDKNDNDFVIGLVGNELYPLSAVVQRMRGTEQTSRYLEKLGPFFVGRAIWRTGDEADAKPQGRW